LCHLVIGTTLLGEASLGKFKHAGCKPRMLTISS
jgi:hypothetical protein